MTELVIATNNKGKLYEISLLLQHIALLTLNDIGFNEEIPEPYDTFEQNALIKAQTVYEFCRKNTAADDSGLCVNALAGAPGVISAHYSGTRNDEENLQKVLDEMNNMTDRSAYYKAVVCLIWNGEAYFFEGICKGSITTGKRGTVGFGYDPIFVPDGYTETFAELPMHIKNQISHRAKAFNKMAAFVQEQEMTSPT